MKHSPRLDSILMIEQMITAHNGEFTKTELWKALPKKMMYQTFKNALKYLEDSKKIMIIRRKVIWIFYPEIYRKLMKQSKKV